MIRWLMTRLHRKCLKACNAEIERSRAAYDAGFAFGVQSALNAWPGEADGSMELGFPFACASGARAKVAQVADALGDTVDTSERDAVLRAIVDGLRPAGVPQRRATVHLDDGRVAKFMIVGIGPALPGSDQVVWREIS